MTKTEKNCIANVIGMLQAIVNGEDSQGKHGHMEQEVEDQCAAPAQEEDDVPDEEEIEFVRNLIDPDIIPIGIRGHSMSINPQTGFSQMRKITVNGDTWLRMIRAYLEKYDK